MLPSKVFNHLQKPFGIHCEKKKSLRIRGEVLPSSHCDCFPSTYTDITLKDRQAGGAKNNMKPAKLTPKHARDITDIGGRGWFFVLFSFLGGKEKNAKK